MKNLHRRPAPKIRCEAVDTADFGYGDPEYIECGAPATYRTHYLPEPYHPGLVRFQVCTFHADLARAEGDPVRFYRFRRVAGEVRYRRHPRGTAQEVPTLNPLGA